MDAGRDIVIDATYLERESTGQGRVARELLQAIRFLVVSGEVPAIRAATFSGQIASQYALDGVPRSTMGLSARVAGWGHFLRVVNLAKRLRPRPDSVLWLSPERYGGPLEGVRQTVMVHDLASIRMPELYPRRSRWLRRASLRRIKGGDCHVICISEATGRDLVEIAGVSTDRISVIHHGVSERFCVLDRGLVLSRLAGLGLANTPFLLFVGKPGPRKNISTLLRAFKEVRKEVRALHLVIAGPGGHAVDQLCRAVSLSRGDRGAVTAVGRVTDEQLVALYNGAVATVFPSLYEGFGLPVLEAMACGSPVICSNSSSLPEVVGEAGILLDPLAPQQWVTALCQVLADTELRFQLAEKGVCRARRFTWQAAARSVMALLDVPTSQTPSPTVTEQ